MCCNSNTQTHVNSGSITKATLPYFRGTSIITIYTCCTQTHNHLTTSRTKTNRRTNREHYTRSNAATARLLTLVKPAETLERDWPNTKMRRGMVTSTIAFLSIIYRRNITLTGTQTSINVLLSEIWFTNLEQTPLNRIRSQQLPAPYKQLIDEIKQN